MGLAFPLLGGGNGSLWRSPQSTCPVRAQQEFVPTWDADPALYTLKGIHLPFTIPLHSPWSPQKEVVLINVVLYPNIQPEGRVSTQLLPQQVCSNRCVSGKQASSRCVYLKVVIAGVFPRRYPKQAFSQIHPWQVGLRTRKPLSCCPLPSSPLPPALPCGCASYRSSQVFLSFELHSVQRSLIQDYFLHTGMLLSRNPPRNASYSVPATQVFSCEVHSRTGLQPYNCVPQRCA